MKILTPIGSKERFLEMYQGVNKMKLNENMFGDEGINEADKAFNLLLNDELEIKQVNNNLREGLTILDIVGVDSAGNTYSFEFEVSSNPMDQDNVTRVDNAKLNKINFNTDELDPNAVQNLNVKYPDQIIDIASENSDFESDDIGVDEEMYEEAVKFIDKIPYKKGSEEIQTHKAYADQKPTNPELRVDNDELQKFVQEGDEEFVPHGAYTVSNSGGYEVMLNDSGDAARVRDAFGSDNPRTSDWLEIEYVPDEETGESEPVIDPNGYNIPLNMVMRLQETDEDLQKFVQEMEDFVASAEEDDILDLPPDYIGGEVPQDTENDVEIDDDNDDASPEDQALFSQVYDSLVAAGNQAPTMIDIENEINRLQGNQKPVEKTRAIPKGTEQFWEGSAVDDINVHDVVKQGYEKLVSPDKKRELIFKAKEIVDEDLGDTVNRIPEEMYKKAIKATAMELYRDDSMDMNESTDQDKYEDVVFMQGEEANEPLDILNTQGEDAAMKYLQQWHSPGQHMGSAELGHGSSDQIYEKDGYIMAWNTPLNYIGLQYEVSGIDEETEKSDYPDQIGKKFKPKNQMPKKKKKPQAVVKLGEDSEISSEKPEDGDFIEGGKADDEHISKFDPEQITMGMKVEMEHTDDPRIALEIAMDHLEEISDYYTRLDKMEKEAGVTDEGMGDNTPEEEELTDELLGYKPHNVNDYASEEFDYAAAEREYADKEDMEQNPEDYEGGEEHPLDGVMDKKVDDREEIIDEEDGFEEYAGEIGDRYQDAENNQFTVRDKVKGGVTLQGQGGEKEIATNDIQFLKKLSEMANKHVVVFDGSSAYVEDENNVPEDVEIVGKYDNIDDAQAFADKYNNSAYAITEEQVKMARQALNNRGLNEGMTKKEAVQILIKHNIK